MICKICNREIIGKNYKIETFAPMNYSNLDKDIEDLKQIHYVCKDCFKKIIGLTK